MAEGISTYHGLAAPLSGEYEQTQIDPTKDMVTLTIGATSTSDYIVMQNSTGTEHVVVSSSGLITTQGGFQKTLSSSGQGPGFEVKLTSTGAIAAGAVLGNAFLVSTSSKSAINAAYAYQNDASAVGVTNFLLACHGSKSPDYFLGIGATAVGVGAATDNGFVNAGIFLTSALATTVAMVGLKVQFGDSVFYIMCVTETAMS